MKSWDAIQVHCICRMPEVNGVDMIDAAIVKLGTILFHCVPRDATQSEK